MLFRMLYDRKLAQAAYLIGCQRTREAIIIDPQRDVERYLAVAENEGLKIVAVAETHIHADFLSGAREFAERIGARVYLSDEGGPDWNYRWLDKKPQGGIYDHQLLREGDIFKVGNIQFQAMHTPGHTPEHLSYLVTDLGGGAMEPMGIASGDFVFVGDVGRPDLLETAAGQVGTKEAAARMLCEAIARFKELPDYLQVWPGHGSGSACGKALGSVPQSTVGYERRFNAAVTAANDEATFVESILYGQPEPPLYFARMKTENRDGPALLGKVPNPKVMSAERVREMVNEENAVLDTRPWPKFMEGHLPGALFTPLNTAFPTLAGSYVRPRTPIYLIVEKNRLTEAVIDLIHVGLDQISGYVTPEALEDYRVMGGTLKKSKFMTMTQLNHHLRDPKVQLLDVRNPDEYESGHLPNAINIAHTRLLAYLDEMPRDKKLMVHCLSGERSTYATAMLESHGFDATQLEGGYLAWLRAGGKINESEPI